MTCEDDDENEKDNRLHELEELIAGAGLAIIACFFVCFVVLAICTNLFDLMRKYG